MTSKVKAKYWKVNEQIVKLQIKTDKEQYMLEEVLSGWECVSFGYIPKSKEDIYVFEKSFKCESDWNKFLSSEKISNLIEMKEVRND
ncbi:MAG: hypothetical protein CMC82_02030 [Flavobacteriaceae bacterium]|nr:hypothetical protein [Flavobacteriaceae bacterium]|tara:strand:- start:933 stop:1193 length:261 start_codon:yes stop_codon:yes gene_type:complete